jgi:hypothetical protein
MNRKKTKNQIKELKSKLKAANKASHVRLFKIALVLSPFCIWEFSKKAPV